MLDLTADQLGAVAAKPPSPRSDGFRLPARFCAHQRTLMSWPCREDLFGPLIDDARREWAEVARGIARFEAITVVVDPTQEGEARRLLGSDIEVLVMPLDDFVGTVTTGPSSYATTGWQCRGR